MAKTVEELEKMFTETQSKVDLMKKDFELKLESANRDVKQFEELAKSREEELRKFKEQVTKAEKDKAEAVARSREADVKEYVESLVKAEMITPAQKDQVSEFMKSLDFEKEIASFSEKDGSKKSHNQTSLFKEIVSKISGGKKKVKLQDEIAISSASETEEIDGTSHEGKNFMKVRSEGVVRNIPVADEVYHIKALEYIEDQRKIGKMVSYGDAMIAVYPKKIPV